MLHKDGTRWDDDRYADRETAEKAIGAWYSGVRAAHPGTDMLFRLMDTPELGRINEDGDAELIVDNA